jgi:DNA-binding IclR family transcriptional regulator
VGENPPPKYTDHSVTGLEDLLDQVEQARECGYATDLEEYRKGVRGLSVLVFRGARACGAISIFGLAGSMEDQRLSDIILHMKNAARLVSRKVTLMAENPGGPDGPVDPPRSVGSSEARLSEVR